MKTWKIICLIFLINALFFSCNRNVNNKKEQVTQEPTIEIVVVIPDEPSIVDNDAGGSQEAAVISFTEDGNYDWIMEYTWGISDGRFLVDQSISPLDWVGPSPYVVFGKLEIPSDIVIYQERLRFERFTLMYQTEERDKIYGFENKASYLVGVFDLGFNEDYSFLSMIRDSTDYARQNRVGEQTDPDFPLVGIWGHLPNLAEYRLVDPEDSIYFMEIIEPLVGWRIPFSAVRIGTYFLRQTGDNTFETVSSFPDGRLRLEIKGERTMILTQLFTLSEEENEKEKFIDILMLSRSPFKIGEMEIEEKDDFF